MVTRRKLRGVGRVWPVSLLLTAGTMWVLPEPLAPSAIAARATLADDAPGGMTFEKDGADIKIKSIAPGSAAAGAGLKVGDYLYTVGGKKVGDLSVGEVMKLFADAGRAAECVFVTGAGEKTLTVNGAGGGGGGERHDEPAPEPRREPERRRDDNRTPMPVPAQPGFNPAVNLMPNWEGAGTPDWVKPGMRISYYQAAASVMGSRYQWVEDPNGDYENKKNGKRYRRTDAGGNVGNSSASGDGVSQYDIIAVDGGSVAVTASTFGINRWTNPPTLTALPCTGGFSRGAAVEGLWVHPDLLQRVQTMDLGDILVLRGPYPLNGKTYDSLSIVTQGAGYS